MNETQVRTELQLSLFKWQQEAVAVTALDERIAAARDTLARCERVLHETGEWRDLDAAKEALTDAKRAALAGDSDVADAKGEVKAARAELRAKAKTPFDAYRAAKGALKALESSRAEAAERVVKGVAGGAS